MDTGHLLLLLLFALTIGHLVTLKVCSVALDHKTAPLFISAWTLLGLCAVWPLYGGLWKEGWAAFMERPGLLALSAFKGVLLCYLFVVSQALMKVSLSSRHYVTPLAVGLITISNFFLGESLKPHEWFAALGLCALAAGFFFRGHLSDLDREGRLAYGKLVAVAAALSVLDQAVMRHVNWYAFLAVSYAVVLAAAVFWNRKSRKNFKTALLHRAAIVAGLFYAATELVKFYQQVTINPVTVVVTAQAMTKPVILVLSALVWKERTVREQLAWGALAFLVTLPLFVPPETLKAVFITLPLSLAGDILGP